MSELKYTPPEFAYVKRVLDDDGVGSWMTCPTDDLEGSWMKVANGIPAVATHSVKKQFRKAVKKAIKNFKMKLGKVKCKTKGVEGYNYD